MKKIITFFLIKIVGFIINKLSKRYKSDDFLILIISESNFLSGLNEKDLSIRIEYSMAISHLTRYLKNVALKMYACSLCFYLAKNYIYALDSLLDIFIIDEFRKKLLYKKEKICIF